MAQCVQVTQNLDGTLTFRPDSQTNLNQCAYVIQSGDEIGNSLTDLTPDQALTIGTSVAVLWSIAWGYRQVAKVINSGNSNEID